MSGPEERTVKSLSELPTAIEPQRDLWPEIEARLKGAAVTGVVAPPPVRARLAQLRWLAAAAMVASVAVGVWIGRDLLPLGRPVGAPAQVANGTSGVTEGAAVEAAYVSDPRYRHEREQLLKSLQTQLDAMPAPARAKVAASLASIETAKKDLEGALGKDPSNALLQELLINTYQDEMRALTDVHEASEPGRGI
jgi:hypothetical protein